MEPFSLRLSRSCFKQVEPGGTRQSEPGSGSLFDGRCASRNFSEFRMALAAPKCVSIERAARASRLSTYKLLIYINAIQHVYNKKEPPLTCLLQLVGSARISRSRRFAFLDTKGVKRQIAHLTVTGLGSFLATKCGQFCSDFLFAQYYIGIRCYFC